METTVLLIFGVVYLGMILGGLPFLQLDRTGIALLGAGALSLEEAWEAVHVPTLILLFAFMVVDAAQRRCVTIDWKRHARTGIPVTLATMAISWVYLWFRVLH
jgi:Na+/H+ antiporter NhaD/arsenite permease-like protein